MAPVPTRLTHTRLPSRGAVVVQRPEETVIVADDRLTQTELDTIVATVNAHQPGIVNEG